MVRIFLPASEGFIPALAVHDSQTNVTSPFQAANSSFKEYSWSVTNLGHHQLAESTGLADHAAAASPRPAAPVANHVRPAELQKMTRLV